MKVSAHVPHQEQTRLWPDDREIRSPAQLRPFVGRFYEEVARVAFGLHRHVTDSSADICPDLSDGKRRFVEVKSVRQGTGGIIYRDRILRDRQLLNKTRGKLTYAFCIHDAQLNRIMSLRVLQLAFELSRIVCVPFATIEAWSNDLNLRTLNYRSGGKPMLGWRIPWSRIERQTFGVQSYALPGLRAFDIGLSWVQFYGKP